MTKSLPLSGLVQKMRERRGWTRGQLARRIGVTSTVLYNMETDRTRTELTRFLEIMELCTGDAQATINRHLFSVQGLPNLESDQIVKAFRNRLRLTQKKLAAALGYRSGSMIHHFEKGIREPSLEDFFGLMKLAGDNGRGLVWELTGDKEFANLFPEGREATQGEWHEYWETFYIPGIRQIMRTHTYREMRRYNPGFFADVLGITYEEEKRALEVLKTLNLIYWEKAKPLINASARIIIPKDIPKEKLDSFKFQWQDFARQHYLEGEPDQVLCTLDLLHVNQEIFALIKKRIRSLQDEIHNLKLRQTDGIIYLGWSANYVPLPNSSGTMGR